MASSLPVGDDLQELEARQDPRLLRALDIVAPGTALREGIDNIVHSRTGGLIVIAPNGQKVATGFTGRRAIVEASGGVTLATVRAIAELGVDWISVGALTHSAPSMDLGLDFECSG